MTPAALILTSDFELCHMIRLAVERCGIDAAFALQSADALKHLDKNKFDLFIVDCSDLEQGCAALRYMRLHRTHRNAVAVAILTDRRYTKLACDAGANFVVEHAHYEAELPATLRSAYGLILRERGRYNRFPLNRPVMVRCGEFAGDAWIENVSQGGVCIRGVTQPLHGPIQLKFAPEEGSNVLLVTGNPVWQRDQRVGVQFTSMPTASRTELNDWLSRQFEYMGKLPSLPVPGAAPGPGQTESGDSRTFGKSGEIRAIVTAVIRGGPVRARCSACQMTITFGNTIGDPLDQERKLREAFVIHLHDKHPEELVDGLTDSAESSSPHTRPH